LPVEVLQLTPLANKGDNELHSKYAVRRWSEIPDKEKWLSDYGGSVRAIVTAGHLGVENDLMDRLPLLGIVAIAGVGYEGSTVIGRGTAASESPTHPVC
jgi:hydroxypyruvate reductase